MPKTKSRGNNDIAIVDFLDLETSKITFQKPKQNKHNGTQIGIRHNEKTLYVKYEGVTPFGIQENYDSEGKFYGVSMQINASEEYAQKAQELDVFFINAFLQNKWGVNKNTRREAIYGYDEHGEGGLWKRILKKPYRMRENEREYLDYPSKMEFALYFRGDRLQTSIFDRDCKLLPSENYTQVGPQSQVKFIAAWFSLSRGTFGLTLKPKLMQVRFRERENPFEGCLLGDSETEEEDEEVKALDWDGYDEYPEK